MTDYRLILLFGGRSCEHEVSLSSAASVAERLADTELSPTVIGISRAGDWLLYTGAPARIRDGSWELDRAHLTPVHPRHGAICRTDTGKPLPPSIVYPCLHGPYCEDGRLQGMLELFDIPFIGSGTEASAVCMNKVLTKNILSRHSIPMASKVDATVRSDDDIIRLILRAEARFRYPMFVKPARAGSSVGARPVNDRTELAEAISAAAQTDRLVMIERFIVGREIEISILEGDPPVIAPPAEPRYRARYYDYDAKYRGGGAELRIPADLPPHTARHLKQLAEQIFRTLGCRHLARVDFFVGRRGEIWFNEINTLPGMTEASIYPRALAAAGIQFPELIHRLMRLAAEDVR